MLNRIITSILCLCMLSSLAQTGDTGRVMVKGEIKDKNLDPVSYAHIQVKSRSEGWVGDYYGKFSAGLISGDTLIISAVSFHHAIIPIPLLVNTDEYLLEVIMHKDTVNLKELVVYPWPSTYEQLKKEFISLEVEDPLANLRLHLPPPAEMRNLAYPEGGIVMPGPVGLLYNKFSREARSRRTYASLMKKEKADRRYNISVVSRITGMKKEEDIKEFMEFCALQIRFILESTDYELYAAIMDCYREYCKTGSGILIPGE